MTPTFDLPRSFDPAEFLSGRLLLHADDARWLVSTILRKTANRDIDIWGCVRLHSDILYRVLGKRAAGKIVRALDMGGAIETTSYRAGVQTKGYRLTKRYLSDRCVRVPCTNPQLLDRLAREHERMQNQYEKARARWLPIHHALDTEQHRLSIVPEADAILDVLPEHTRLCQDVLTSRIRNRELPFTVGTTGRCFNAITGLKRELRSALRIDGEPIGGVDIVNAQPALLAAEISHKAPTIGPKGVETYKHTLAVPLSLACPADLSCFLSLAFDGFLYDFLVRQSGLSRDSVKLGLLQDVLAKRGRYPSRVEDIFRREFPEVYSFIRHVNRDDHAELIRRLQRAESRLVIENVAPRLIGQVPVITLHDAIYSAQTALDSVERAFDEVFDDLGFRLRLKREIMGCHKLEQTA